MNGRSIIMTANASARAIKPELLRTYTEDFNKDRANLIAADAAVSAGVLKAATDYRGVRALPRDSPSNSSRVRSPIRSVPAVAGCSPP